MLIGGDEGLRMGEMGVGKCEKVEAGEIRKKEEEDWKSTCLLVQYEEET